MAANYPIERLLCSESYLYNLVPEPPLAPPDEAWAAQIVAGTRGVS